MKFWPLLLSLGLTSGAFGGDTLRYTSSGDGIFPNLSITYIDNGDTLDSNLHLNFLLDANYTEITDGNNGDTVRVDEDVVNYVRASLLFFGGKRKTGYLIDKVNGVISVEEKKGRTRPMPYGDNVYTLTGMFRDVLENGVNSRYDVLVDGGTSELRVYEFEENREYYLNMRGFHPNLPIDHFMVWGHDVGNGFFVDSTEACFNKKYDFFRKKLRIDD